MYSAKVVIFLYLMSKEYGKSSDFEEFAIGFTTFYIIINKAIEVVSGFADYAYKAGISDKWVKQISEEIRYRVELVK